MTTPIKNEQLKSSRPANAQRNWIIDNPLLDLLKLAFRPQSVSADSTIVRWIKRNPILAVVSLAYILTWVGLIPVIRDPSVATHATLDNARNPSVLVYAFIGVLGCLWAAVIVAGAIGGIKGRYDLLRGYLKWQVGFQWILAALLSPALVLAGTVGLDTLLTGKLQVIPLFSLLSTAFVSTYLFSIVRYMLGNFEEICWRATVLPRLQAKNSALVSSVIVGVIQGFWHLPYLFIKGHYVQSIGLPAIILQSIAMGIVAAWLYNNTRGSLLIVALFHAAYDALSPFQGTDIKLLYLSIGVWCIAAILIVIVFGARHFSRKSEFELNYTIISAENEMVVTRPE